MTNHPERRSDFGMHALQDLELTLPVLRLADRTCLAPRRPGRLITCAVNIYFDHKPAYCALTDPR